MKFDNCHNGMYIGVHSNNPNVCLQAVDDLIKMADTAVQEFSVDSNYEQSNLPIRIDAHYLDDDKDKYSAIFSMWDSTGNSSFDFPKSKFKLSNTVVNKETGVHYTIRARIFYPPRLQWYYAVVPYYKQNADPTQLPEDILWSLGRFAHLLDRLAEATGGITWLWNHETGMIESSKNKTKKMQPQDMVKQILMFENNEETPF